jgi:hypothetical protein
MTCCLTGCRTCRDELRAVRRNEKLTALILRQLREGPTPSICTIDSEEWHGDDGYDPADNDDLPELFPDSEDMTKRMITFSTLCSPPSRFALAAPSHSASRRLMPRTQCPPEPVSRPGLRTSQTSSTRNPSTLCRRSEHETMPLNSSRTRSRQTARSTRSPHSNRRSSMPSLRRG